MPVTFQPRPGQVLICDFRGYEVPEMVKRRPVVVVARNRQNRSLVTVVPLSTTEPNPLTSAHHSLPISPTTGGPPPCWAKCDMVATVSLARLDRVMRRDRGGKRTYVVPVLSDADLAAVRRAVASALDLAHIGPVPERDL